MPFNMSDSDGEQVTTSVVHSPNVMNSSNDSGGPVTQSWNIPPNSPAGIAMTVALCISLTCLMVRVILQPFIKVYHTFPGKIQFGLVVVQCLGKVTLALRPLFVGNPVHCAVFGGLFTWEILASFFWMNAMALHTFKTFGPNAPTKMATKRQERRRFRLILLYTAISPTVLTSLAVLMDYLDIDEKFKPGFYNTHCWFTQPVHLAIYTIAPIGILVFINLFLFLISTKHISRTMKTSNYIKTSKERSERLIFMKLFIMIGLNWVFALIHVLVSFLTGIKALYYMVLILAASDGIGTFIVTVCTKRVWRQLRGIHGNSQARSKSDEQSKSSSNRQKVSKEQSISNRENEADMTISTNIESGSTHL